MRSGENTPHMSFDLDRQGEDRQAQPIDSVSRRIMVRQNSDSGFSGYVKKFDQISNKKRVPSITNLEFAEAVQHELFFHGSKR